MIFLPIFTKYLANPNYPKHLDQFPDFSELQNPEKLRHACDIIRKQKFKGETSNQIWDKPSLYIIFGYNLLISNDFVIAIKICCKEIENDINQVEYIC